MIRIIVAVACVLTLTIPTGPVWTQDDGPAAVVLDLDGAIVLETADGKKRPLEWLEILPASSKLHLEKGAWAALGYFAAGVKETIAGPVEAVLTAEGSRFPGGGAMTRIEAPFLPGEAMVFQIYVQGMKSPKDLAPSSGNIVACTMNLTHIRPGAKPVFAWRPVKGAPSYSIQVLDDAMESLHGMDIYEAAGRYEAPGLELASGRQYLWNLAAVGDRGALAEGQWTFYTLSEEQAAALKELEAGIESETEKGSRERSASLLMLYESYGLRDEAADLAKEILKKHPKNRAVRDLVGILAPCDGKP
jgi:hypothetical protein